MSKQSIYETNWINLVFENRNKEYGAYQLRQESSKTSIFALFMGLLLCVSLMSIPRILSVFSPTTIIPPDTIIPSERIIELSDIFTEKTKPVAEPVAPKIIEQKPLDIIPDKQLVNPVVVETSQAIQDIAKNTDNVTVTNPSIEGTGITGLNPTSGEGTGTGIDSGGNGTSDYGESIVTSAILDSQPEFPGGMKKFYTYVGRNFRTPEIDNENMIRIFVSFVVEKDGSMTAIHVNKDPGYGLGTEAIRVLKSLKTKWKPGIINSQPVRTAYSLPIVVQIN